MLRNRLLSTTAYFLAPDDEKGQKSAADLQRESIKVENSNDKADEKIEEEKVEAKEGDEEVIEEQEEEVDEKLEASDEKVEELEEQLEDKTLTAKQREKLETRIAKERKKNKDLRDENESLKRQLAAKPDDEKVFTEEEIVKRAKEMAKEEINVREFEAAVNRIAAAAKKIDKDYKDKVTAMSEDYNDGVIPGQMIGILDDLPNNGGDVLMYLTKHEDEYEEIHVLSPAKMAIKLKEISDKLKKQTKQISKVPAPNNPLKGKGQTPEVLRDDMPMEDWVRIRAEQADRHRKIKMGLH
jgi:hypothetical protein